MIQTFPYPRNLEGSEALRLHIENSIKSETDPRVREKYLWLRDRFNEFVSADEDQVEFKTPIK